MSSSTTNTYRQYKHGTETMFTWLSESLDKLGITLDRRLEDASIRSLLDLASRAQRSGASMPYKVLYALEDALKIRRQYHAWYSSQLSQSSSNEDNKNIEQSNEAHAAFIDVLQYIHNLFAPAKTSADQPQSSISADKKILEITNLFDSLEMEVVTDEESSVVPMVKPSSDTERPAKPWMVRKSQMLIEDKLLELYCLYDDANKIREYLRKTWAKYASREIDIQSAAMITQEALELFSGIEEAFDDKYGTVPDESPDAAYLKFMDIYSHLAFGEPVRSTYTWESHESMTATAKLEARSGISHRIRRFLDSDWDPSRELSDWVMGSAAFMIYDVLLKGDNWVLEQACRTTADRADALDACTQITADRGFLDTFIDIYAGMIFLKQNSRAFIVPHDVITHMWLGRYDASISMILSVQVLHDIRTARSESGQLDILAQVSEDYKKLGCDLVDFSRVRHTQLVDNRAFQVQADTERSWLQGRVPGQINQLRKAETQKLSELPLLMNPVLAGMFLFEQSYLRYCSHIGHVNDKWFLVPFTHLINWLLLRARRRARPDFQNLWPDLHAAIGMIGPRQVWLGASPPETLDNCRNRILLAWGLQLKDFYRRILSGNIPKAEELFRKIKNNTNDRNKLDEVLELLLNGEALPSAFVAKWNTNEGLSHPLKIETSQCTPLIDAVRENLRSSELLNAQQSHIRKIIMASSAADMTSNSTKAPGSKNKSREEPDMLSYLDAFSRTVQAEMPRLLFPYKRVSLQCFGLSVWLFGHNRSSFDLSSDILKCAALVELESSGTKDADKLGSGAQSVSSLLALATIFGDRIDNCPIEHLMLDFIEEDWDQKTDLPPRDKFVKEFVEKCKEFGFAVPECAMAALSSPDPAGQSI